MQLDEDKSTKKTFKKTVKTMEAEGVIYVKEDGEVGIVKKSKKRKKEKKEKK
eukprot:CAMPEP_0118658688 /NCGR_PEP_ID=MMETSP0785-20121206/14706_1 /TAXON_ID=91992 /ORGANISM="Bolidomonas pacifica, Strain CCMP 1866" /LENGTH=51 /DNA_ID=CAMNT_0006551731 /DNA_START=215 /DNA_END=367 /DNA_ORIENTATION=-